MNWKMFALVCTMSAAVALTAVLGKKGQVRQAKLGRTNSGRSYIVKKSTYD